MAKITFLTFYADYSTGVQLLASILMNAGHEVSVIFFKLETQSRIEWFKENPTFYEKVSTSGDLIGYNSDVNRWTDYEVELLISTISKLCPDALLVSCKSPHEEVTFDVVPKVKAQCGLMTIAGGFGPTLEPDLYANVFDYVFVGDAENAILEIASAIGDDERISGIKNVCYKRSDGTIVKNRLRVPDINKFRLGEMPRDVFYIEGNKVFNIEERGSIVKTNAYSTFFGRGCISSCSYCSAGQYYKLYRKEGINVGKRRNRLLEDVIDELKSIIDKEYTFVHFRDEFLCASTNLLKCFFNLYEREIGLPFWAYLVPQQVLANPELLKMAVDAGFVDTELGFQSGSDQINRKIFTRQVSNRQTAAYAELLAMYDINVKYDLIIFNPAETAEDIKKTYELIQSLPKERAYLQLARLHYWPMSPIINILKDYHVRQEDYARYYCTALLYHLCFVLPPQEFDRILQNEKLTSSWQRLKAFYQEYLNSHGIEFPIGTHEVPNSITTHRYGRILKKKSYSQVIVWGNGDYYKEMAEIFRGINIRYHIDDKEDNIPLNSRIVPPEILSNIDEALPLFICSPRKQEIKMKIVTDFPEYGGRIYV